MTPDKVIAWAREAGWPSITIDYLLGTKDLERLTRFAQLARADKQEQCAKVCAARDMGDGSREDQEARRCESAIRALKD